MSMSYREWMEMAAATYDVVSRNYNQRVYESVVENPKTKEREMVQLTLRDVFYMCEGTIFETQLRQAVMRCVYTEDSLEKEIASVMDLYYS